MVVDVVGHVAGNLVDGRGLLHPVVFTGREPIDLLSGNARYVSASVTAMAGDGRIVGWGVLRKADAAHTHCLLWTPAGG